MFVKYDAHKPYPYPIILVLDEMYLFTVCSDDNGQYICMYVLLYCNDRDELKQIVTSDLRQLLGAEGEPNFLTYVCFMIMIIIIIIKM